MCVSRVYNIMCTGDLEVSFFGKVSLRTQHTLSAKKFDRLVKCCHQAKKDMNACEDFFILIWRSYVTTAAMKVLGISSKDEWPSYIPKDVWLQDKDKRQKGMDLILSKIIDDFVHVSFNSPRPRPCPTNDKVFLYAVQLLSIGCSCLLFWLILNEGNVLL